MRSNRLLWTMVLLVTLVGLTATVSAQMETGLVIRADDDSTSAAEKTTAPRIRTTSTSADGAETTADEGDKKTTTADKDDKKTTSIRIRSSTGDDKAATGTESVRIRTSTSIDPNAPPGGIVMVTPAITDGFPLYAIGKTITWSYNYTSLRVTPTAINVEAFCSKTQLWYTIAQNYSVNARTVTWDTDGYQQTGSPLIAAETYALYMYDSAAQKTSMPQPGKLGLFNTFTFAMYTPRGNIKLDEYQCPTCSGASSILESHYFRVLFGTAAIMAASFGWFIYWAL